MSLTPEKSLRLAIVLLGAIFALPQQASAINVVIDYTYDSNSFFTNNTAARNSLEAAASLFSRMLDDTFSPISTPPDFPSTAGGTGIAMWTWSHNFFHPGTGANQVVVDDSFAQDEFRIYAGARSLTGTTLGQGGFGGGSWAATNNGGTFSPAEISQINAITADFSLAVEDRGETSGFARWGGSVTFDTDGPASFHFDHTTAPSAGLADFFSVAVHEIGHVLGLGDSDEWFALVNNMSFTGANAVAEFGGPVPLDQPDEDHFENDIMSTILGTSTIQEVSMDPDIAIGMRKLWTNLDAAALSDIGWEVTAIPEPSQVLLFGCITYGVVCNYRRGSSRSTRQGL